MIKNYKRRTHLKKVLITIGCLLISINTWAASNATATALNQKLLQIKTLTANFKQTVTNADGSSLQTSVGKLYIARPGKFRWETSSPIEQKIITNGKTLWIYEPDLAQVTIRQLTQDLAKTPLLLLTNKDIALQSEFNVQQLRSNNYRLTPKAKQSDFKQIDVGFAGNNQITSMQLINNLNQKTNIKFSSVRVNPGLSDKLFTFKVPPHVDVIDTTKKS